jgi:hypothetical protein
MIYNLCNLNYQSTCLVQHKILARYEVLTAVKMPKLFFRAEDGDSMVFSERWYLPTSPHCVTTQKNNIVKVHAFIPSLRKRTCLEASENGNRDVPGGYKM